MRPTVHLRRYICQMSLHLPDFESRDLDRYVINKMMQQWVISAN